MFIAKNTEASQHGSNILLLGNSRKLFWKTKIEGNACDMTINPFLSKRQVQFM